MVEGYSTTSNSDDCSFEVGSIPEMELSQRRLSANDHAKFELKLQLSKPPQKPVLSDATSSIVNTCLNS